MERSGFIEYLKDPYLVVKFQKYFGVYSLKELKEKNNSNKTQRSRTTSLIKDRPSEKGHLKHRHLDLTSVNDLGVTDKCSSEVGDNCELNVETKPNGKISSNSLGPLEDTLSSESDAETLPYVVTIKFWYYFFLFGTYLGDEVFYASFIPFWFWNIDGAVGRRIVMVWTIVMYIGQGIKDIVCWARPTSPPVFRLQKKWALEHGMPSTHAMVGIAIPFSVVIYTMNRYQYPVAWGIAVAVCWCAVISLSRIYLGMHSVLYDKNYRSYLETKVAFGSTVN